MSDDKGSQPVRKSERLQHELLVAYRTVDGFITDWAVNISRGGIFINTRNPLAVGKASSPKVRKLESRDPEHAAVLVAQHPHHKVGVAVDRKILKPKVVGVLV